MSGSPGRAKSVPRFSRSLCLPRSFWAIVAMVSSPVAAPGQSAPMETVIPSAALCSACRIEIGTASRIVGAGAEGFASIPISVAVARNGNVFVGLSDSERLPWVVGRDGKVRAVGRQGRGPGEFGRATFLTVIPGDTLIVLDMGNARMSFHDPQLRYVRSAPAPMETMGVTWVNASEAVLLNAIIRDRERINLPFHLFDRLGNARGSFGPPQPTVTPGNESLSRRFVMAAIRTGGLITARIVDNRHEIGIWDTDARRLIRRVSVESHPVAVSKSRDGYPTPARYIAAIGQDARGRVWILEIVPDRQWRRGVVAEPIGEGRSDKKGWRIIDQDFEKYYDTNIEVLDLEAGRVLARSRIDQSCRFVTPQLELMCDQRNDDGTYGLSIHTVRLDQTVKR